MLSQKPLTLDFSKSETPSLILPNSPLLTSHRSNWNGVHLAHYHQPPWELPEISGEQHTIYLPFSNQCANVELFSEGCLQNIKFDVKEYDNCWGILPAHLAYRLCWDVEVKFVHLYIEPTFLAQIAHESVNSDRVEIALKPKKFDSLIHQIGLTLKAELERDGVGDRFYADSMATALSAHLLKHYATRSHTFRAYEDGLSKQKLKQALEYINEHLGENLALTTIADELGMSQYYFCRLFKQSTGLSPHRYLIQQRVERAKQLLRQPGLTVTQIAIECGFTHQSHLARYFRQYTGVTPTQFRQT